MATVRHAVAVLRTEGLVETRTKAGTLVRARPPVHRLAAGRYRQPSPERGPDGPADPSAPFAAGQQLSCSRDGIDARFERIRASAELASLFAAEIGEPLLARHYLLHSHGAPSQLCVSYLRWSDVAGTPVTDPANSPWPGGTRAQLATIGIHVRRITEAFTAGMPTPAEAAALRLGSGQPVLRCTRRHLEPDGRVAELTHPIVRRAESTVVEFTFDLE